MTNEQRSQDEVINKSGYLFQIKIADQIKNFPPANWRLLVEEYPWSENDTGAEKRTGYIDLVLERVTVRMVIECKRQQDTSWHFLANKSASKTPVGYFLWTLQNSGEFYSDYADFYAEPNTLSSDMCIISRDKAESNLEKIASGLVYSTEAIAEQWGKIKPDVMPEWFVYVPVIVTSATLVASRYDPNQIDANTGKITEGTSHEEVPYIRFTKSLTTHWRNNPNSIQDAIRKAQRTVFIVNSTHFDDFLTDFDISFKTRARMSPPWQFLLRN